MQLLLMKPQILQRKMKLPVPTNCPLQILKHNIVSEQINFLKIQILIYENENRFKEKELTEILILFFIFQS